jgi:hypothetical protein
VSGGTRGQKHKKIIDFTIQNNEEVAAGKIRKEWIRATIRPTIRPTIRATIRPDDEARR